MQQPPREDGERLFSTLFVSDEHFDVATAEVLKLPEEGTPGADIQDMIDHVAKIARNTEDGNYDEITGGWNSYSDIVTKAHENAWNPYNIDYSTDRATAEAFDDRTREALLTVLATLKSAEGMVADWIRRIRVSVGVNRDRNEDGSLKHHDLWLALGTQEGDEGQHDDSAANLYEKVAGIEGGREEIEKVTAQYNNFANKIAFAMVEQIFEKLLIREGKQVPFDNVRLAIFTYGLVCEYVVAMGDMHMRRKNQKQNLFGPDYEPDLTNLDQARQWLRSRFGGNFDSPEAEDSDPGDKPVKFPGIDEGQKNTARDEGRHYGIAFLSTRDWLQEEETAPEQLMLVVDIFMELSSELLIRAKQDSHGLIDDFLKQGYGPQIDALYYYTVLANRVGQILGSLHLKDEVAQVHAQMVKMQEMFTDETMQPIIEDRPIYLRNRKWGAWILRKMGGKPLHVHALDRLFEYVDEREKPKDFVEGETVDLATGNR